MELIHLVSHQALIVEASPQILDLANLLNIVSDINLEDDHIFIVSARELSLGSFFIRRNTDVLLSTDKFSEVLLDIKSGMSTLAAFNRQGYTFKDKEKDEE